MERTREREKGRGRFSSRFFVFWWALYDHRRLCTRTESLGGGYVVLVASTMRPPQGLQLRARGLNGSSPSTPTRVQIIVVWCVHYDVTLWKPWTNMSSGLVQARGWSSGVQHLYETTLSLTLLMTKDSSTLAVYLQLTRPNKWGGKSDDKTNEYFTQSKHLYM